MDVKKWLSRAYKIDKQIESKLEQIEVWRSIAEKMTTNTAAQPRGGGKGFGNNFEECCIKINDAKEAIEKQLKDLINIKRETETTIAKVEDITLRVLLERRYLLGGKWSEIAEFMGYGSIYIKKNLHGEALKLIEKILKNS